MFYPLNSAPLCSPLDVAAPQFSKTKSAFLPHALNTPSSLNLRDLREEPKRQKTEIEVSEVTVLDLALPAVNEDV